MQSRATFDIQVKGNFVISGKLQKNTTLNLTFTAETNIIEHQRIKNETADLLGGIKKVVDLELAIEEAYKAHLNYCLEKYGEEDFKKMRAKILKLEEEEKADSKEYKKIFDKLYTNQHYAEYAYLINSRMDVGEYVWLNVMCVDKPDGFSFYDQKDESELDKIVKEVKAKRKFFREQTEKNDADSKPSTTEAGS